MITTVAIFAHCRKCGAGRMFNRVSKAGYACTICAAPKPKNSPIRRRITRPNIRKERNSVRMTRLRSLPNFPERIYALRERHGMTQVELAQHMGVSFASVNRWENGHRPSPLAIKRLLQLERKARRAT
jgi:DNA-binding transcriptional regulator YiaG